MHRKFFPNIDYTVLFSVLPIVLAGLVTMNSFSGETNLATRQVVWVAVSLVVFFVFSLVDWRFLKKTKVIMTLFLVLSFLLVLLLVVGETIKGVKSWFSFGAFSFQPVDYVKIVLIALLAKYFSKRHVEIADWRHVAVSGTYAFLMFALILLQPDFGSAMIIFFIWFGMTMVSGISKKHLLAVFLIGALSALFFWSFVFQDYQKARIISFISPMSDIRGSGYNAYQSMIAVGSGGFLGKGVGYGTQSRLQFLPEHETDFIFAAFAEEWGFVGIMIIIFCYAVLVYRLLRSAMEGATNFESFFGLGVVIMIISQVFINIGMNLGLLPITGITLPFMSYGGSHLLAEFSALGIMMGMRKYGRPIRRQSVEMTSEHL